MAAKTTISASSASARIHSPFGKMRLSTNWNSTGSYSVPSPDCIEAHSRQNDGALDRLLPIRVDAEERQRRTDGSQQDHTEKRPRDGPPSSRNGGPADHNRGDHLHLQ